VLLESEPTFGVRLQLRTPLEFVELVRVALKAWLEPPAVKVRLEGVRFRAG